MNAPDKIYLNKYMIRPGMLYPAQYPADTPEFEYIRKEFLLEWAEEEMMKAAKQSDAYGRRNAFMDVIYKIESL